MFRIDVELVLQPAGWKIDARLHDISNHWGGHLRNCKFSLHAYRTKIFMIVQTSWLCVGLTVEIIKNIFSCQYGKKKKYLSFLIACSMSLRMHLFICTLEDMLV